MKKKQSQKLLLHKTTVSNLEAAARNNIVGGAAVAQYPTNGCDSKNDTCVRSCKGMVSCLHACTSYPDNNGCYTEPRPADFTVIEDDMVN
jgi:hypothetical protein